MSAELDFTGLDDAEAHPPKLPVGKHVVEVVLHKPFIHEGNQNVTITAKVLSTDNPREAKVGMEYEWVIWHLRSIKYPKSTTGLKRLRTYMAAALAVPGNEPPPKEIASSWTELANKVINEDPEGMAGDKLLVVVTQNENNPKYQDYAYLPAPE